MNNLWNRFVALVCVSGATACVSSEVTYTGKAKYPASPPGCPIEIFPSTTPNYEWEDLASVDTSCHSTVGRTACIDELKKKTCELGGDTLYGLKDGKKQEYHLVIGTVAKRTGGEIEKSGGTPPASKPSGCSPVCSPGYTCEDSKCVAGCNPPCSPGYACEDSQCVAQCNPPCGEGQVCNQQRSCEDAAE